MNDGHIRDRLSDGESRCGFELALNGEYCGQKGEVSLDGLRLCERHAEHLRLEERAAYWRALVAHVQLWLGEAQRRGRGDVAGLLEVEQAKASAAMVRASEALQRNKDGDASRDGKEGQDGEDEVRSPPSWWPPLLALLVLSLAVAG